MGAVAGGPGFLVVSCQSDETARNSRDPKQWLA